MPLSLIFPYSMWLAIPIGIVSGTASDTDLFKNVMKWGLFCGVKFRLAIPICSNIFGFNVDFDYLDCVTLIVNDYFIGQ